MDPLLIGLCTFLVLVTIIAAGVPVAFAMACIAVVGMTLVAGWPFALTTIKNLPFALGTDFAFVVIPMFILMGALTSKSGMTAELYTAADRWTSGLRGSLYYATTLAAGGFAAINGSAMVGSAVFTRIALPEMLRFRYDPGLSAGCICAAGTFAAMIPPSVAMVLYALLTQESVGALLMAGILPGLLTIVVYMVGLRVLLAKFPDLAPPVRQKPTLSEKFSVLRPLWAILGLAIVVLGGIYSGLMYPSTAGAAGAAGALGIGLIRRKLGMATIWEAAKEALSVTAVLFLIMAGGLLLSRYLLVSGFISEVVGVVGSVDLAVWVFLIGIVLLYMVLGMFVDGVSLMIMTIPFLYPVAQELQIDPVWFGVILIKLIEFAGITPPVGLNLYAVLSAAEGQVESKRLFIGVTPFLLFEFCTLVLLLMFPQIAVWLPRAMFQ